MTRYITPEESAHPENFKRDTYEDCVKQICDDCETAMSLLPLTYSGGDAILGDISFGRASGLAAAALKARVLLYAASPAYQSDRVVKLNGMGAVSYTHLTGVWKLVDTVYASSFKGGRVNAQPGALRCV